MNPEPPKPLKGASKKHDSSTQNESEENNAPSDEQGANETSQIENQEGNVVAKLHSIPTKQRANKIATDSSVEETIDASSSDEHSSDARKAHEKCKKNENLDQNVDVSNSESARKKTNKIANQTNGTEIVTPIPDDSSTKGLDSHGEIHKVGTIATPSQIVKRKWTTKKSLDKDFIGCTTFEIGINRRRGLRFTKTKTKPCDLPTNDGDDNKGVVDLPVMNNSHTRMSMKPTSPFQKKGKSPNSTKIPTQKADTNDDKEMSTCQHKMSKKPTEPSQKKAKHRKSSRTLGSSKVDTEEDEDTDVYSYESTDETNKPNTPVPATNLTSDYDAETDEYETEEDLHFPKQTLNVKKSRKSSPNSSDRTSTQSSTSSGADDEGSSSTVSKKAAKKFQLRVKLFRPKKGASRGATRSKILTRSRIKSVEVTEEVDANGFHEQKNTGNENTIPESEIDSTETSAQTSVSDSSVGNKKVPTTKCSVKRRKSKRSGLPKVDGSKSGIGLTSTISSKETKSHDNQSSVGQLGTLSDIAVIFASDLENQISRAQENELPFEINQGTPNQTLHSEFATQFPMYLPTLTSIVNEFHNNAGPVTNHVGYEWNTLVPNPSLYSPTISTSDYACSPVDPVRDSAILPPPIPV